MAGKAEEGLVVDGGEGRGWAEKWMTILWGWLGLGG